MVQADKRSYYRDTLILRVYIKITEVFDTTQNLMKLTFIDDLLTTNEPFSRILFLTCFPINIEHLHNSSFQLG